MKVGLSLRTGSLAAAVGLMLCVSPAFAAPIFHSDTQYQIVETGGNMTGLGNFGNLNFTTDSYLVYDSASQKLTIDGKLTTSKFPNTVLDFDIVFGGMTLSGGAFDTDPGVQADVNLPKGGSHANFGMPAGAPYKNGEAMVGTLGADTPFNIAGNAKVPAGYDFPVFATGNMKPYVRAEGNDLYFDAWIRVWGDGPFITVGKHNNFHYDWTTDIHVKLVEKTPPPHTDVPEPMSMSLLATGLLGSAVARRRKMKSA